jgi:hypothetical protein
MNPGISYVDDETYRAAQRRRQLKDQIRAHIRAHRAKVILALCGTGMAYNEVEVLLDMAETNIP